MLKDLTLINADILILSGVQIEDILIKSVINENNNYKITRVNFINKQITILHVYDLVLESFNIDENTLFFGFFFQVVYQMIYMPINKFLYIKYNSIALKSLLLKT